MRDKHEWYEIKSTENQVSKEEENDIVGKTKYSTGLQKPLISFEGVVKEVGNVESLVLETACEQIE